MLATHSFVHFAILALAIIPSISAGAATERSTVESNKQATRVLSRGHDDSAVPRQVQPIKQLTRGEAIAIKRNRDERRKRGALKPRASLTPGSYQTCPVAYNLDVAGLVYYPNYDYTGPNVASKNINNLHDCYQYCLATSGCGSFVWNAAAFACYLKGPAAALTTTSGSWSLNDGNVNSQYSGIYVLATTCGGMQAQVPAAVDQVCCTTPAYVAPADTQCPSLYNVNPGATPLAYVTNWDFSSSYFASKTLNNLQDCFNYCATTATCAAFNWVPASFACYLKTTLSNSSPGSWTKNNGFSAGVSGGTYLMNSGCAAADLPSTVSPDCCAVIPYVAPASTSCPAMYNLNTGGDALAYFVNWDYNANGVASKNVNTLQDCYNYCKTTATCGAFDWDSAGLGCYLRLAPGVSSSPGSWAYKDGISTGTASGTYVMGTSCANADVPITVASACCDTVPYVAPADTTCPALYNLKVASPGLTYFTNWDYTPNNLGSQTLNTIQDCYNYCVATSGCVAFNWTPGTLACYVKTYATVGGWSYNDGYATGVGGGTYFLNSDCATVDVPANVIGSCCQTPVYTTPTYPTCGAGTPIATSGIAYYPSWDYFGYDVANSGSTTTVDLCKQFCDSTANCASFTYNKNGNACYTKGPVAGLTHGPTWSYNDGFVQGVGGGTYAYKTCEQMDALGIVPAKAQAACCNTS